MEKFQRAQMTRKNSPSAWKTTKTMVLFLLCLELMILTMSEAVTPRLHHFNSANAIQTHGANFYLGKARKVHVTFVILDSFSCPSRKSLFNGLSTEDAASSGAVPFKGPAETEERNTIEQASSEFTLKCIFIHTRLRETDSLKLFPTISNFPLFKKASSGEAERKSAGPRERFGRWRRRGRDPGVRGDLASRTAAGFFS